MLRDKPPRVLKHGRELAVRGFDTETLNGYPKILCASDKYFTTVQDGTDALSFLTQNRYRETLNFWFNVQFDLDGIMKYLPSDLIRDFYKDGSTIFNGLEISYIPGKMFKISKHKNTWSYYDVNNFYEMSLEKAARDYIAGVKNEDNLDRAMIGTSRQYWLDNYDDIVKYCISDAGLTAQLGEHLQETAKKAMGFFPTSYVSKANLSMQYFRSTCAIPDITKISHNIQRYWYESYHGGRFEVTKRGKMGYCTNLDIKSAYPYEISKLIDITKGTWKKTRECHPDAYYGVYLVKVRIPYMFLCPLAMTWHNSVIYPCGQWHAYLTKVELDALPRQCSYNVINGFEFWPSEIVYPFKDEIDHLFSLKNKAPKKSFEYSLYKIMLNSLYGKFYQKIPTAGEKFKTGQLFNPIYASMITAGTRVKLYQKALQYGERAVSMATDGILIEGEIDEDQGKQLGEWEIEEAADTYILRSGIYAYGSEVKQRGVLASAHCNTPYGYFDNLFDYIRFYPGMREYPLISTRPYHMKEALTHDQDEFIELVNIFDEHEQTFNINTDIKRIFDRTDLTGEDLVTKKINSKPHNFWLEPAEWHRPKRADRRR